MSEPKGRVYGGLSEPERRAARRARLVEAGLDLFGTEGWHAVTIERLCAGASVATRSFYEEFPGRESLIQAVYDEVVRGATLAVVAALGSAGPVLADRISAGVGAYLRHVTDDPRRAQVAYREVRAVGGLEQHRHEVMLGFAQLMETNLDGPVLPTEPDRRRVMTLALAGAVSEVLVDWVAAPEPRPPLEPICDELSRLFTAVLVPRDGG
ncbi:MAG TPA: helix-turn-helix domain-containing protein [Mycobacteriales bacterium]|nr:helix-turn-helix domain-containing protein [Mycobacteriales bacterium]